MKPERVRELTVAVWGAQACQVNPGDWPRVFAALMKPATKAEGKNTTSEGNHGRQSLKPALDEAVAALTAAFGADTPPDDPVAAVWICFSKLDLAHRTQLAKLLMEERTHAMEA